MSEETKTTTMLDDEMPVAPTNDDVPFGNEQELTLDTGMVSMDMVDKGVNFTHLPPGLYHVRLEKYACKGKIVEDGMGPNPYFSCEWVVVNPSQHAGRKIMFDNVTWVRKYDVERAAAGDPEAGIIMQNRMGRMKQLMKAAQFSKRSFDVQKDFLDTKPEVNAKVSVKDRKMFDEIKNEWVKTGKRDNEILEYLPLMKR